MTRSLLIMNVALVALVSFVSGCRSNDPYCQTAIANLRAEKIQLENEYYALKSQYESDMSRLGQAAPTTSTPIYSTPAFSTPVMPGTVPGTIEGDIFYENPSLDSGGVLPEPIIGSESGDSSMILRSPSSELAGYIRSIEVNQIAAMNGETTRLLIRPLDSQGAILPVTGDLKVRLYDPAGGATVYENEFPANRVTSMIKDQPGQQPGIHLPIPLVRQASSVERLICDLQYRTADNRVLKQTTELVFSTTSTVPRQRRPNPASRQANTNSQRQPAGRPAARPPLQTQNASQPMLPDSIDGALEIEIGEELNFDNLDAGGSRPSWSPDR